MLPPFSSFFSSPVAFTRTCIEVFKLHTAHVSAETAERRKRKVEDVQKRGEYRKAHGLDTDTGFGGWTAKKDNEDLGPAIPIGDGAANAEAGAAANGQDGAVSVPIKEKKPLKMWFGIW
jgi:hypothetical protein